MSTPPDNGRRVIAETLERLDLEQLRVRAEAAGVSTAHLDREALLEELRARESAPGAVTMVSASELALRRVETTHPRPGEPLGMLDFAELPEVVGGGDTCEILPRDPGWMFVYWEVADGSVVGARAQLGREPAALTLRIFVTTAQAVGVTRQIRDVPLGWNHGRRYIEVRRPGAHVRSAVGVLGDDGRFVPLANSSLVRMPWAEPAAPSRVDWLEVGAARGRGRERLLLFMRGRGTSEHYLRLPGGALHPPGSSRLGTREQP